MKRLFLLFAALAVCAPATVSATPPTTMYLSVHRASSPLLGPDTLVVTWDPAVTTGSPVDSYRITIKKDALTLVGAAALPATAKGYNQVLLGVAPGQSVTLSVTVEAHNLKGWSDPFTASQTYLGADAVPSAPVVRLNIKVVP